MIAKGSPSVSIEDIHRKYTDFDIAHRYLGITCVPEVMVSPLRQDRNPSLSIFESNRRPGSLMFRDFGTGEHGSLYYLLGKMWGISFPEVLSRIDRDMPEPVELRRSRIKVYRKSAGKVDGDMEAKHPILYPNPTTGYIRIDCHEEEINSISLYDMSGKNMLSVQSSGQHEEEIDMSRLPSGQYIMVVRTKDNTYSEKIILNK